MYHDEFSTLHNFCFSFFQIICYIPGLWSITHCISSFRIMLNNFRMMSTWATTSNFDKNILKVSMHTTRTSHNVHSSQHIKKSARNSCNWKTEQTEFKKILPHYLFPMTYLYPIVGIKCIKKNFLRFPRYMHNNWKLLSILNLLRMSHKKIL